MSGEIEHGMRELRRSLLKCAEIACSMNIPSDFSDMKELRSDLANNILKCMELDGRSRKFLKVYDEVLKLSNDMASNGDPSVDALIEVFEKTEKGMEAVKSENWKKFNQMAKEIVEKGDEGMEVMQMVYSKKDPISKKDIVDPVRVQGCQHVYDRTSITEFAGKRRVIDCAYQGCSTRFRISDLEEFPAYFDNIEKNS